MNLIDGSSVWVQSVSQTLTEIPGVELTLLLRTHEQRDVLTAPLHANPRIELVDPDQLRQREAPGLRVGCPRTREPRRRTELRRRASARRRHLRGGGPSPHLPGTTLVLLPDAARVPAGSGGRSAEADRSGLRAGALPNGSDPRARCCGYPRPGGQARAAATDDPSSLQVSRGAGGDRGSKPRICRQVRPRVLLPGDHRHLPAAAARPPGCRVPSDRRQDPQPA